jgi:hypothetical protein
MQASGSGELFLAYQAMLVRVLRLNNQSLTVNGFNILAFEDGITGTSRASREAQPACSPGASSTST